MGSIVILLVIVLLIIFNFIPSIIAYRRDMASFFPLFLINLFFGCTGIVWLVRLIWACEGRIKKIKTPNF